MTRTSVVLTILAAASLALLAWSLSNYVQSRKPLPPRVVADTTCDSINDPVYNPDTIRILVFGEVDTLKGWRFDQATIDRIFKDRYWGVMALPIPSRDGWFERYFYVIRNKR
jgi:hypothetical protein